MLHLLYNVRSEFFKSLLLGESSTMWKRILITGASSGLGWALSLQMAKPGITLWLSGRDVERLDTLAKLVQERGATAHICQADLSTENGVQQLQSIIEQELPDLLIHNAGLGAYGRFVETSIDRSLEIMQVNVMAIMKLTHTWCRTLLNKKMSGKVVFVSSIAALFPTPGMTVYGASKACLSGFAEGLRFELRDSGIRVLTVCPGHFATNFQRRAAGKSLGAPASDEAVAMARDILRVLDREGVYIPMKWKIVLPLARLLPKRWIMTQLERQIIANLGNNSVRPNERDG